MEAEPPPANQNNFDDTQRIAKCKAKPELINLNQIYPNDSGSHCGYCNKDDTSYSWSFTKEKMQPYTYQLLMERGWRRSGTYFYKPNLQKSCCKLFTHRLEVQKYKPKKDQKKALKKVIAIAYEKIQEMKDEQKQQKQVNKQMNKKQQKLPKQIMTANTTLDLTKVCEKITVFLKVQLPHLIKQFALTQAIFSEFNFDLNGKLKFFNSNVGEKYQYYSNYVQLIYGLNKKIFGINKYSLISFCKEVKSGVQSIGAINGYQVEVQRGGYLLFKRTEKTNQFQILQEKNEVQPNKKQESGIMGFFQTIKNKFKSSSSQHLQEKKNSNQYEVLKPQNKYKGEINITTNNITFGKITIDIVPAQENVQSFKLYQTYTKDIHQKKEKSMSSYVNFLCQQPLEYRKEKSTIKPEQKDKYVPAWDPTSKHQQPKEISGQISKLLGCYHMKYFYEGKLIAVSVVDFVDDGLSAVYFFYDPSFKQFRLGVFSSLIQIEYLRWVKLSFPQFRYYYMGFYISNCEKMNYKVDYSPCQLLCPITYKFVDFTQEIKMLTDKIAEGKEKNIRLTKQAQKVNEDMSFGKDIGPYIDKNIKILYNNKKLVLKEINPHFYIHILKIINVNLPVWGKKIFEIWTFTL